MTSLPGIKRILITKGDTLSQLAIAYGTDVETLLSLNPDIICRDLIYAGNGLYVPSNEVPKRLHTQALVQPITAQVTPDSGLTACSSVQPSPCSKPEAEEIIYFPSTKQWFVLTADLKKQVEDVVERLKIVSEKAGKLYQQPADTDVKILSQLRNEVFNELEKEGLLEAFKGGYYATFMDAPTREKYTDLKLQLVMLTNMKRNPIYTDQLDVERYQEIEHVFDSTGKLQIQQALTKISSADTAQIGYLPEIEQAYWPISTAALGSLGDVVRGAFTRVINQVEAQVKQQENAAWAYASDKYQLAKFKNRTVNRAQVAQYRTIWPALSQASRERIQGFALVDYAKKKGLTPEPHPNIPSDERPGLSELWQLACDDNSHVHVPELEEVICANENGAVLPEQVLSIDRLLGGFGNWMDIQREDSRIAAWRWDKLESLALLAAQTQQATGVPGVWGLRQWLGMKARVESLLEQQSIYQRGTLGDAGEHLLKPGLVALELCHKQISLLMNAAQKQAEKGTNGILSGFYHPKRIAPKLSLLWQSADFSFEVPTILLNTDSKQLVECYLMSKSKQPCYITSHEQALITKQPNIFAKELLLRPNLKEADKKTTVQQWRDSGAFATQFSEQMKLSSPKFSFKGELDDEFINHTGGLYYNWLAVDGEGLVTMHTDAQAAFFRFSSGCGSQQQFDTLLGELSAGNKDGAVDALKQLGSAQANMTLDVAKGQVGMSLYVPHHKGYPFTLSFITKQQENKRALLGLFRLKTNATLHGWTGASVAMAGQLNLIGGEGAFSISGSEPLRHDSGEPYSYNKGYKARQASQAVAKNVAGVGATVDAFAGVELGVCASGTVQWKPWQLTQQGRRTQYVGVLSESIVKEMLASGQESQLTGLINQQLARQHQVIGLADEFEELFHLSKSVAVNWGLGLSGGMALGIYDQKLVAGFSARLVCGPGASGEFAAELSPLVLEKFVNAFCNVLAQENFARLAIFHEDEQQQSSYRFLNEAMTFSLASGATLGQALLMRFDELLKKNNEALRQEFAPNVAQSIVDERNRLSNEAWFERLLPEVRGRLFYLLSQAQTVSNQQQAQALSLLLGYWSNDIQATEAMILPRQIEESFTRYTPDGEKPFPEGNGLDRYCNRLMPMAVFLKVQQVIESAKIADPRGETKARIGTLKAKYFSREFEQVRVDNPAQLSQLNALYQGGSDVSDTLLGGIANNEIKSLADIKSLLTKKAGQLWQGNTGGALPTVRCFYMARRERPESAEQLQLAWLMVCNKVGLAPESVKS